MTTLINKRTQKPFWSYQPSPSWMDEEPEPEHRQDGMRYVETASYEGHMYACVCGCLFMERDDRDKHIEANLPAETAIPNEGLLAAGLATLALAILGALFIFGWLSL